MLIYWTIGMIDWFLWNLKSCSKAKLINFSYFYKVKWNSYYRVFCCCINFSSDLILGIDRLNLDDPGNEFFLKI